MEAGVGLERPARRVARRQCRGSGKRCLAFLTAGLVSLCLLSLTRVILPIPLLAGPGPGDPPAPFCIQGIVFNDINEDGVRNGPSLEPALAGFRIQIFLDRNGNGDLDVGDFPPWETITTQATWYHSGELDAGTYFVNAEAPIAEPPWVRTLPQGPVMLILSGPGGDFCETANFGFKRMPVGPTSAEVRSFTATTTGHDVILRWETITEIDNLGFNIWRSLQPASGYERVNRRLIPSQAIGTHGASYEHVDRGVPAGFWYYKLETISTAGRTEGWHGPISIWLRERGGRCIYLPLITR